MGGRRGRECIVTTLRMMTLLRRKRKQVGQRVRWKILGELPFVADVMVNIAVETKPCPAMSSLRPQEDIEQASIFIFISFMFLSAG